GRRIRPQHEAQLELRLVPFPERHVALRELVTRAIRTRIERQRGAEERRGRAFIAARPGGEPAQERDARVLGPDRGDLREQLFCADRLALVEPSPREAQGVLARGVLDADLAVGAAGDGWLGRRLSARGRRKAERRETQGEARRDPRDRAR